MLLVVPKDKTLGSSKNFTGEDDFFTLLEHNSKRCLLNELLRSQDCVAEQSFGFISGFGCGPDSVEVYHAGTRQ